MTMLTVTEQPQPSRRQLAAQTRSDRGRVTRKLKDCLDLVVFEGLDPYEAAAKLGMTARAMRLALNRRPVVAYLRAQREVFRTTASAQNIHRAIKLRDTSGNAMAQLGAMKFIEGIDDERQSAASRMQSPGFVIVVQAQAAAPARSVDTNADNIRMIEHEQDQEPDKPA